MCKMNINIKTHHSSEQVTTTLTAGSVPSCLRNRNDPPRKQPLDRRVSFPDDDQNMVTGFLEPANPWEYADSVSKDDLVSKYIRSCEKHGARPISRVISQLQVLDFDQDRNDCLDLKGEMLGPAACETLEEILKRIQFVTINLESTNIDDESSVALFDMMEYYESAVRLNISGNHCIAARGWQACSRMIKRTKCLEELDARNTTLNEQYMPILSRALRLSTQLHVLKLENCNLSGRPIVILTAALKLNTGLKELYLGDNYLTNNDAMQLSALLKVNTVLQLLDISNNSIHDEGLGHIVEGLLEQNSAGGGLQVLILWNNNLTRSCGHHLSRIFSTTTSLETINIGQNTLSNEVLHVNKFALQKNRNLLRLGMQSTHLSCEGAVALAEIIADNPTMQRIDLRDNNLQVAGLMALVLSMRVNRSVTQLDLDDMPRRKHSMGPALDEYMRLVAEIRGHCETNTKNVKKPEDIEEEPIKEEAILPNIERRSRMGSFATRKISLTCETLARSQAMPAPESNQQLLTEPKRTGGRLRSPAPSPIPSPVASPSPTRSRFQVSRVAESDSPVTPPSSSPNVFFGSSSRFKVTMVDTGAPTTPTTVLTSNNITVGFETSSTLSPNVSVSPAPSPTPIPAPLLSSIPSLFPTPMPSPMPSPLMSPNPSPTYISPLSTINVGEAHPLSPLIGGDNNNIKEGEKSSFQLEISHHVPVIVSDLSSKESFKKDKEDNTSPIIITKSDNSRLETHNESNKVSAFRETTVEENRPDSRIEHTSSSEFSLDKDCSSISSNKLNPRNSVSPSKVCQLSSESEDNERDLFKNRKLPKATDSLDLSALRVMKQASVSVPEKPSGASHRVRKISSWVQPSAMFSAITQDDTGKTSSGLERLLGLFTNPFSRSKVDEGPSQQLERVPEVAESSAQQCDYKLEQTCTDEDTAVKSTNTNQNSDETIQLIPQDETDQLEHNSVVNEKECGISTNQNVNKNTISVTSCDENKHHVNNSTEKISDNNAGENLNVIDTTIHLVNTDIQIETNEYSTENTSDADGNENLCDNGVPIISFSQNTQLKYNEDPTQENNEIYSNENVYASNASEIALSENVQLKNSSCDNSTNNVRDIYANSSIKNTLSSESEAFDLKSQVQADICSVGCCPVSKGCEPTCDKQDVNIPFIFHNSEGPSDTELGEVKCETWPQGTSMAQLNLIHRAQSHSSPCLTALVFLKGNMASNLAAEIKKMSPPTNEESVEPANNISLAL